LIQRLFNYLCPVISSDLFDSVSRPQRFCPPSYRSLGQSFFSYFNFLEMNIFVSNLSFQVQDQDLLEIFAEYGEVSSAKVITDKFSGRSRGFGFVEMASEEEAKKAIAELDQAEVDGRTISVAEAKPREQRPERKSFSGGGSGGGGTRSGGGGGYNKFNKRY
jgi:RNA recognition motif-containing protein